MTGPFNDRDELRAVSQVLCLHPCVTVTHTEKHIHQPPEACLLIVQLALKFLYIAYLFMDSKHHEVFSWNNFSTV